MSKQVSYPHQNWEPVILRSRKPQTKQVKKSEPSGPVELKYNAGKNTQKKSTINANRVEQAIDEEENLSVPTISYSLQIQLQQGRLQKGWTQKQLANECQLPEHTVKNYENGSIIPNAQDMVKMGRALGVTLKNK